MNNYSDKETGELVSVSIGLSKILSKTPLVLNKEDFDTLDMNYNVFDYLKKAKKFLYIPEIDKMFNSIGKAYEPIIASKLSKALNNLKYIREKGIESWDKKYEVSNNYKHAKEFIPFEQEPETENLLKRVEKIYKIFFKNQWGKKLNEEID